MKSTRGGFDFVSGSSFAAARVAGVVEIEAPFRRHAGSITRKSNEEIGSEAAQALDVRE